MFGRRRFDMCQFTPVPEGGYLVGGAVRDLLLGRAASDLDWLVADSEGAARAAATALSGSAFALDLARGHWRVIAGEQTRDFIRLEGDLDADLRRRDFTVNAVALDESGKLHDPLGGRADLRARRLRLAAPDALRADPLRALRALRFEATLGLRPDDELKAALHACAAAQRSGAWDPPALERAREELDKLLLAPGGAGALQAAQDVGLLAVYLPELANAAGVPQGGFHHLDVLGHSLEALARLASGFPDADLALRWATLLHDVGKPATRTYDEAGDYWHFYGHAELGAELTAARLTALRQPERLARRAGALVRYHMLPLPKNAREARRFVHRRRALLPDLLKLMSADREAARGPLASVQSRRAYRLAMARVLEVLEAPPPPAPLLGGREVMGLLGISEGPRVGEAVRFLAEAEAVGDVRTREEAEATLRRYAARQGWTG